MMQRVLGDLGGKVDMRAVVAEVKDRITEELDYRIELAHQQEFADLYRDHPSIGVPEVVPELSTERVLTMQYVDAMRWPAAVAATKELRDAWGRTIALFVFGSLYNHHLFNADPHPGNYLFHEDGRVTFLDFGCVKHFAPELVDRMKAMLNAARRDDPDEMLDAFVGTGMLRSREGVDVETAVSYIRRAYEPVVVRQPYTYTREWAAAQMADVVELRLDAGRRSFLRQADLPSDSVFLLRITAGLSSVLAGLEATIDWDELGDQLGLYDGGSPATPASP
jgi:predicted unusual protein kinase regulating ubiquinone biosynthesis (AarF/ABC1/UbiB family)